MHPFTGRDHALAMLLLGLFAYRLGGRALWMLPLAFLAAMAPRRQRYGVAASPVTPWVSAWTRSRGNTSSSGLLSGST